jgi:Flp pilus assembly protein TadG
MTQRIQDDSSTRARRGRGDDGAALVEFALIAVLLATLVFGIINFGFLLSFKQDMTRAAAEGARAGAVAPDPLNAVAAATSATNEAVEGFGKACGEGGMTCTISPATFDCDGIGAGTAKCVEVTLEYDYKDHPLLPDFPIISAFMPDQVSATSVARVNPAVAP